MSPSVSSSLSGWVVWDSSGLTVEMKPGLLVSDRLSLPYPDPGHRWKPSNGLWLQEVSAGCDGRPSLYLYHSFGCQKAHDWSVEQLADLFRTTNHTKTKYVTKNRGRHCGDIQLVTYLVNVSGPVPLVLDLRIAHDHFGSSSDPNLNGHLHYPHDVDTSLNEATTDKIRKYRTDYNKNPPSVVSFTFLQLQEFSLRNPPVPHFLLLNTFLSMACFAWGGVINPWLCLAMQD
jgi:hypothetical protein